MCAASIDSSIIYTREENENSERAGRRRKAKRQKKIWNELSNLILRARFRSVRGAREVLHSNPPKINLRFTQQKKSLKLIPLRFNGESLDRMYRIVFGGEDRGPSRPFGPH